MDLKSPPFSHSRDLPMARGDIPRGVAYGSQVSLPKAFSKEIDLLGLYQMKKID